MDKRAFFRPVFFVIIAAMSDIPAIEPEVVTAGDYITWEKSLSDYPASAGWVLTYALLNSSAKLTITATASGDDHLVAIAAATSAAYTAGVYQWQSYVTKTTERYTIATGSITVKANLSGITVATDTRTHVKKVLDAIEALIEGRATTGEQEMTIDGTRLVKMTVEQLLALRGRYYAYYQQELAAEKIARGLGTGSGKIRVRL